MDMVLYFLLALFLLGLLISPFPHWPSYWRLWGKVLKDPAPATAKWRQAWFLLRSFAKFSFSGLCWLLDELLFPSYRKRTIEPVFIIGQPRCGTTLLHRTLAHDKDNFFAIRHIEWRYPYICVQKAIHWLGIDKRLDSAEYWPNNEAGKKAAKMHPNRLSDWEEDGIFFEENHLHHFFIFLRFPYLDLLEYMEAFPELPVREREHMLDTYHQVLQKIAYLRGPEERFFLSKEVTSHNKIPFYLERYPNARFILTVRESRDFISSLLPLVCSSTHSKTGVDPISIAGWQEAVIHRMRVDTRLLVSLCREVIPPERMVSIFSNDYMRHIVSATEAIYDRLGFSMSDHFRSYLQGLSEQQRKRVRGYDYNTIEAEGFEEYDRFVLEVKRSFQLKKP